MLRRAFVSAVYRRTARLRSLPTALRNLPNLGRPAMVRARAASHSGVSIPFGAAHRVNFDNPPLKGSCEVSLRILRRVAQTAPLRQIMDTPGYLGIPKYPCVI